MTDPELPPEMVILLAGILAESAFQMWGDTRIGRLSNRTPFEAMAEGDYEMVLDLIRGYRDPSFT